MWPADGSTSAPPVGHRNGEPFCLLPACGRLHPKGQKVLISGLGWAGKGVLLGPSREPRARAWLEGPRLKQLGPGVPAGPTKPGRCGGAFGFSRSCCGKPLTVVLGPRDWLLSGWEDGDTLPQGIYVLEGRVASARTAAPSPSAGCGCRKCWGSCRGLLPAPPHGPLGAPRGAGQPPGSSGCRDISHDHCEQS